MSFVVSKAKDIFHMSDAQRCYWAKLQARHLNSAAAGISVISLMQCTAALCGDSRTGSIMLQSKLILCVKAQVKIKRIDGLLCAEVTLLCH